MHRNLTLSEIEQLERQGNYADDWTRVRVADPFCAKRLRNSTFEGCVTLGADPVVVNSTLRNVTLGNADNIRDVRLLSGYTLGDNVTLFDIGEMTCDGTLKRLEVMNENGGRWIIPFAGMTIGDAYMWARFRGHKDFIHKLEAFADEALATQEGARDQVGDGCTVKNAACIRNTALRSCKEDPTTVDGAIALCDGVVGFGCKVEHGVIAERFLLGEHVTLEFGLRLNDTVVGDNSTLARCEVGNSIVFPAHEQHHNNSFLIAGLIMGQSNIAAGGTIGSNHNSRTADNELVAGRGFWPGLCCSFKHSSRFASYCLLAKGDYPSELDIKLPFALVNNNVSQDRLEVMPAYWWMYNMYAMDRNSRKFAKRDKRKLKAQHIEFDSLAPDTAEEILAAMALLRKWIAASTQTLPLDKGEYPEGGKGCTVFGKDMENSKRPTVILKADKALQAYEDMLVFYAMKTLPPSTLNSRPLSPRGVAEGRGVSSTLSSTSWLNIGGQLVAKPDMERLIADVENGTIASWPQLHTRMDTLWEAYPEQRNAHAYSVLCRLEGTNSLSDKQWQRLQQRYAAILQYIEEQKGVSRHKDEINPFRNMTYWDDAERDAVLNS
jgi:hypothetical protein